MVGLSALCGARLQAQPAAPQTTEGHDPARGYLFLRGNTHAHSSFTMTHGEQVTNNDPARNGAPAEHFRRAKAAGYDFYVTTDHSQEVPFEPTSPTNPAWLATKEQALAATDANFVALRGYEHSENNGPDGKGHYNVINSAEYLDALDPGIGVQQFYAWLQTQPGAVVSFNHPDIDSYNSFAYRDDRVTDIITMLEVINSNTKIHYPAFVAALDKGWKVAPVCGNDNHGFSGITRQNSRTVLLAKAKTPDGALEAMRQRRSYATLDTNLQAAYTANGAIMGSTLKTPTRLEFDISVRDPDVTEPTQAIAKIDIVTDGGSVVQSYVPPTPAYAVAWKPVIQNSGGHYFFVRVWNAGSPDPIAWLAPVWTGR